MIERVLVPIDFIAPNVEPQPGELVLEVDERDIRVAPSSTRAIEMARAMTPSAEIRLVHATPALDQGSVYSGPTRLGIIGNAIEEIHASAKATSIAALTALAERFCGDGKSSVAAMPGLALEVILDEAENFDAQMIVLAASGHRRMARFFLGSTADRVIREAQCPVLVLPAPRKSSGRKES